MTAAERHTVALLIAMGAHYPGQRVESKSPDPIHNVETWELGTARVSAEGASSARFNTVTALGIAVEPIVQGPRDSSGGTSGTLWQTFEAIVLKTQLPALGCTAMRRTSG